MKIRNAVASAIMGITLLVVPFTSPKPADAFGVKRVPPSMSKLVDCEDYDITPCYTYDEGSWRVVYSYDPYKSRKVGICKVEDGGPNLPCIWKRTNKGSKPATRNYFWIGNI